MSSIPDFKNFGEFAPMSDFEYNNSEFDSADSTEQLPEAEIPAPVPEAPLLDIEGQVSGSGTLHKRVKSQQVSSMF